MCGRYAFFAPEDAIIRAFGLAGVPDFAPRWNIAPTQTAATIRIAEGGARELTPMRWGLIPAWAKEPEIGSGMINARAETVAEKPSFRAAFKSRRCVVPASGFYEWQKLAGGKQPLYITRIDREPLALAGLWESWTSKGGEETLHTFTIITTAANAFMKPLHHRMPVILDGARLDTWLDAGADRKALAGILKPADDGALEAWPVSKRVNSPKNDDERLVQEAPSP
jgi:putative SOS response-associated peptidase YedK